MVVGLWFYCYLLETTDGKKEAEQCEDPLLGVKNTWIEHKQKVIIVEGEAEITAGKQLCRSQKTRQGETNVDMEDEGQYK